MTILLILVFVFQLIAVAGNAAAWRRYRRQLQAAPHRRVADLSARGLAVPERARGVVGALEALGFERLGEVDAAGAGAQRSLPVWVFTAPGQPVHAELAQARARHVLILSTLFGEKAAIETSYPSGQRIDEPDFKVQPVRDGVRAAYDRHLEQVAAFEQMYGAPRQVASMGDYMVLSAAYNEHFLARKVGAMRPSVLAPLLSSLYGALVLGGGLLAQVIVAPPPFVLAAALVVLILPAMISELGLWMWLSRRL